MIDFSSDVRTFRDDFVSATPANLEAARRYLDQLQANGGTNIDGALDRALSQPRDREGDDDEYTGAHNHQIVARMSLVLFVTDGEPTVGERNPAAIAARTPRGSAARSASSPSASAPTSTRSSSSSSRSRGTAPRSSCAPTRMSSARWASSRRGSRARSRATFV